MVYKNWEPVNTGQLPEAASTMVPAIEYPLQFDDIVVGCSAGHPSELILTLTEEITQLTTMFSDCKLIFYSVVWNIDFRVFDRFYGQ